MTMLETAPVETEVLANFVFEKETPGTLKFKEVPAPGQPPVSGSLYLKKYVAERLGNPNAITMIVTAS